MGSKSNLVLMAALGLLLLVVFPVTHYEGNHLVNVTWTLSEKIPSDHSISIAGQTFSLPAGASSTRRMELEGGGRIDLFFRERRGWGFRHQQLLVDGREIPLDQIIRRSEHGTLRLFGWDVSPPWLCRSSYPDPVLTGDA